MNEGYDWSLNQPFRNTVEKIPFSDEHGEYRWTINGGVRGVVTSSVGTGISGRIGNVIGDKDAEGFLIYEIDLSNIAKEGAPDTILMFAGEPYFRLCGDQKNYVWTTDVPEDFPKPVGGK